MATRIGRCVRGLFLAMLVSAGLPAQPVLTDPVEEARAAYFKARDRETRAKATLAGLRKEAQAQARRLKAARDQNEEVFARANQDASQWRKQLIEKYEELARAAVVPASLLDELAELERRRKILVEYRQYVDDKSYRAVENRVLELKQRLKTAQEERAQKTRALDGDLAKLRRLKQEAEQRMMANIAIPSNSMDEWIASLTKAAEAEKMVTQVQHEADEAFDRYTALLLKTSPPYLKKVRVLAGGKLVYVARWSAKGSQNEIDFIKRAILTFDQQIAEHEHTLREHAELRLVAALDMKPLLSKLERAAASKQNFELARITCTAVMEATSFTVELMCTGGVATVVRHGVDEASQKLFEKAHTLVKQPHLADRLTRIPSQATQELCRRFGPQMEHLLSAEFRAKKANLAAVKALEGPLLPQQCVELHKLMARLRGETASQLAQEYYFEASGAISGKLGIGALMALAGDGAIDGLGLDPVSGQVLSIATSDALEVAFARGVKIAFMQGAEAVSAMREVAAGTGVWPTIKAGGQAFLGKKVLFKNFHEVVRLDKSLGVSVVTSLAKQAVTYSLGTWEQEQQQIFIDTLAELDWLSVQSYVSLKGDERLFFIQKKCREARAELMGMLAGSDGPRKLEVVVDHRLPPPNTVLTLELSFSTYLRRPPVVRLGELNLEVKAEGRPEAAQEWTATISSEKLPLDVDRLQLSVFGDLDSDPSTPAQPRLFGEMKTTVGQESGADLHHRVRCFSLAGNWDASGYERGPETVTIVQAGDAVTATKQIGSTFVGAGQTTWSGKFTGNPFSAQVRSAKSAGRDARWLKGTVQIHDSDHFSIKDEKGWQADFTRQLKGQGPTK